MKYGFIIDNRKCIGCHACTVACKSEHEVPVGVNRTWVKYIEKGEFPNSQRSFSVLRCNHCDDAPCVEICPVTALYKRDDGIVDFDNERCIGCKGCMQACPYDALYIDPETNTAAKCNYCSHRVDIGLEPACVNVCPEQAIISGNMDNPDSEISQLLAREPTMVRKKEKGTVPNLFYLEAEEKSLDPSSAGQSADYLWSSQTRGVGHNHGKAHIMGEVNKGEATRAYDAPDKGILWGWEVPSYLLTKGIAAGISLIIFGISLFGVNVEEHQLIMDFVILAFLGATGVLLVIDLDRPDRFLYVLFRPQWRSWLVKGAYTITIMGLLVTLHLVAMIFEVDRTFTTVIFYCIQPFALLTAVYTAFLFAQAKGRDYWQNPLIPSHMLVHSVLGGCAAIAIFSGMLTSFESLPIRYPIIVLILFNMFHIFSEKFTTHPTIDSAKAASLIFKGKYKNLFIIGVLMIGNMLPLVILTTLDNSLTEAVSGIMVLIGIYLSNHLFVRAPQEIPLS